MLFPFEWDLHKLTILKYTRILLLICILFTGQYFNFSDDRCHLTFLNLAIPGGILRGSRRERLLSKFVENECEKIDRLMELFMRWAGSFFSLLLLNDPE